MNLEQMKQDTAGMIWKFSIPAIISMILTSLVTIADGFFIGNYVGKEGIAAVNLGLPIIYLYLGVNGFHRRRCDRGDGAGRRGSQRL